MTGREASTRYRRRMWRILAALRNDHPDLWADLRARADWPDETTTEQDRDNG